MMTRRTSAFLRLAWLGGVAAFPELHFCLYLSLYLCLYFFVFVFVFVWRSTSPHLALSPLPPLYFRPSKLVGSNLTDGDCNDDTDEYDNDENNGKDKRNYDLDVWSPETEEVTFVLLSESVSDDNDEDHFTLPW